LTATARLPARPCSALLAGPAPSASCPRSLHDALPIFIAAREATGRPLLFDVGDVRPIDLESPLPAVRYRVNGEERELRCDFIAGCHGVHGVCRPSIPSGALTVYDRTYPFACLAILARAAPPTH